MTSTGVNATAPLGGDLKAKRIAAGHSQERLAQLAGCSLSMIRQIERGYRPDGGDVLPRVRRILNNEGPGSTPDLRETATADDGGPRGSG